MVVGVLVSCFTLRLASSKLISKQSFKSMGGHSETNQKIAGELEANFIKNQKANYHFAHFRSSINLSI